MIRRLVAAALLAAATPAAADRALLIGVGDYPGLAPALRLAAPEEDARRLAGALTRAGLAADRITLMTAPAGRPPTRAAVLAQLARLAQEARAGERILVYFSGHGAQAPTATPGAEPDGLDELYLMHDTRGWDGGTGRGVLPGSVSDKELARALDAIRARGADLWFVADACHAGGLYRAGGGVRVKAVPPGALGIPADAPGAPSPPPPVPLPPGAGRIAAFYAAAPGALAVERPLPPGSPDARPLSQFSYALVRAIDAGRLRSLRDLALGIEAADAGIGGDAPAPLFEGALDQPVLNLAADRPRRYPVARGPRPALSAGREEGLAAGDLVLLFRPGGTIAIGTATVAAAALGSATLAGAIPAGAVEAAPALAPLPLAERRAALLEALAPLSARGAAAALAVRATLSRPGAMRVCPARIEGAERAADPLALPPLGQCDVVTLTIVNTGDAPVDLSPLYIDAAGAVTGLGFVGGGSVRMAPGDLRRIAVRTLTQDRTGKPLPTGTERLALVALPATTRDPRDLRAAAAGPVLRSAQAAVGEGAGALVYRWRVGEAP